MPAESAPLQWIDTHCHLDAREFDADRAAVVARADAAGVTMQVLPAVTPSSPSFAIGSSTVRIVPGFAALASMSCSPPRNWPAAM